MSFCFEHRAIISNTRRLTTLQELTANVGDGNGVASDYKALTDKVNECPVGVRFDDDAFILPLLPKLVALVREAVSPAEKASAESLGLMKLLNRLVNMLQADREPSQHIPSQGTLTGLECACGVKKAMDELENATEQEAGAPPRDPMDRDVQKLGKALKSKLLQDHGDRQGSFAEEFAAEKDQHKALYEAAEETSEKYDSLLKRAAEEKVVKSCEKMQEQEILTWFEGKPRNLPMDEVVAIGQDKGLDGDEWKETLVTSFTELTQTSALLVKVYQDCGTHQDDREEDLLMQAEHLLKRAKATTIEGAVFANYVSNVPKKSYAQAKNDMGKHGVVDSDLCGPLSKLLEDKLKGTPAGGAAATGSGAAASSRARRVSFG